MIDFNRQSEYYKFERLSFDGRPISDQSNEEGFQNYKYNGKEMDRMYGLDWLDYGARMDNPAIGLWTQVDPLAEKYYNVSPYVYCAGNPIRYVDPDGRWYWENNGNLHAEVNDNMQTMADFLGTTHKDVMQILERNKISVGKNGKINVKNLGDLSLNKSSLYVMKADKSGIVLESNKQIEASPYVDCLYSPQPLSQNELAVAHYFLGNGEAADVGDRATSMLMNTKIFKDNLEPAIKRVRNVQCRLHGKHYILFYCLCQCRARAKAARMIATKPTTDRRSGTCPKKRNPNADAKRMPE